MSGQQQLMLEAGAASLGGGIGMGAVNSGINMMQAMQGQQMQQSEYIASLGEGIGMGAVNSGINMMQGQQMQQSE